MPVIRISCLPNEPEGKLNQIHLAVVAAVESVKVLGLKGQNSMTVLFPPDMMKYGLGEEIIIEVFGLFDKPERTDEVRNELSRKLGLTLAGFYPKAVVECFVRPFKPKKGFWASNMYAPQPKTLDELIGQIPKGYFSPGTTDLEEQGVHEIMSRLGQLEEKITLTHLEEKLRVKGVEEKDITTIVMTIAEVNGLKPDFAGGWEADK